LNTLLLLAAVALVLVRAAAVALVVTVPALLVKLRAVGLLPNQHSQLFPVRVTP
jgi:hypothetical protein